MAVVFILLKKKNLSMGMWTSVVTVVDVATCCSSLPPLTTVAFLIFFSAVEPPLVPLD